jgi:type I thyroxine 5'-deiodinase
VQFLTIYIREAHPVDGWWLGGGLAGLILKMSRSKAATDIYDPKTIEERRAVAGQCESTLQYGIRTYVDEMDDAVSDAYAALPTRLYLVGLDGRVAYAGGPGPFGFKPAELRAAIEAYLAGRE